MAVNRIDQMIDIRTVVAVDIAQTNVIPNTMVAAAAAAVVAAVATDLAVMVSDSFQQFKLFLIHTYLVIQIVEFKMKIQFEKRIRHIEYKHLLKRANLNSN